MRAPPEPKTPVTLKDGRTGIAIASWKAKFGGRTIVLVELPDGKAVRVRLSELRVTVPVG